MSHEKLEVRGVDPYQHIIQNVNPNAPIKVYFSGGTIVLNPGETLTFDPFGKPVVTKPTEYQEKADR